MKNLVELLEKSRLDEFRYEIQAKPNELYYHMLFNLNELSDDLMTKAIFILSDIGVDINSQNSNRQTCLHLAIKEKISLKIIKTLLQNGADLTQVDKFDKCSYNYVKTLNDSKYEQEVIRVLKAFYPTYTIAIRNGDLASCRRLVNSWCKFNETHVRLARELNQIEIYNLLNKLKLQFDINFAVLSENVSKLTQLDLSRANINFKNMSDHFASLKYYIVDQNSKELIDLFAQHTQFWSIFNDYMLDYHSQDIPLLFRLLENPQLIQIITYIFEKSPEKIDLSYLRYRGLTIIRFMIDLNINLALFEYLINLKWYSNEIFTLRDPQFNTLFDYCVQKNRVDYLAIIQKLILKEISINDQFRTQLLYNGFDFSQEFIENIRHEPHLRAFLLQIPFYHEAIKLLFHQVETNNSYLDIIVCDATKEINLSDAKLPTNSQYLYHRLVFNRDHELLKVLLEKRESQVKLDLLRDHHQRTPLHYAYGMKNNQKCIRLLLDYGFSENVFDKDGKSPLDFAERIDSPEIGELIRLNKDKCFKVQEPNPWSYHVWNDLQKAKIESNNRQLIPFFNANALNYHRCNHKYEIDYLHDANKQYFCNLL